MSLHQYDRNAADSVPHSPLTSMSCATCGYGVSRASAPARCPMCGGNEWEYDRWRPFSDLVRDLKPTRRTSR